MKKYSILAFALTLSGCSIMDRYTESVPTESVTTVYQGPSAPVEQPVKRPIKTLICQKAEVRVQGADAPVELSPTNGYAIAVSGKRVEFLPSDLLPVKLGFDLEPVLVYPERKVAMGWSGNDVAEFVVSSDHTVTLTLHRYNVPVDKSFNGVTHNLNILSHLAYSDCK